MATLEAWKWAFSGGVLIGDLRIDMQLGFSDPSCHVYQEKNLTNRVRSVE